MDFGSAVCIPKTPRCGECPIVNMCEAYQHKDTDKLPVRIKKTNGSRGAFIRGDLAV